MSAAAPTPPRRAPRLGPREYIAPHMTRAGRFADVDPLVARPLPSLGRWVGAVAWGILVEESLRRAWKSSQDGDGD